MPSLLEVIVVADLIVLVLALLFVALGHKSNPGYGSGAFGAGLIMLMGGAVAFLCVLVLGICGVVYLAGWGAGAVLFGLLIAGVAWIGRERRVNEAKRTQE
jgi:Na+/proline symporter